MSVNTTDVGVKLEDKDSAAKSCTAKRIGNYSLQCFHGLLAAFPLPHGFLAAANSS